MKKGRDPAVAVPHPSVLLPESSELAPLPLRRHEPCGRGLSRVAGDEAVLEPERFRVRLRLRRHPCGCTLPLRPISANAKCTRGARVGAPSPPARPLVNPAGCAWRCARKVAKSCSSGLSLRDTSIGRAPAVILLEFSLELEHVAEILGARESESAKLLRRDRVVPHRLPEGLGQSGGHLRSCQVLAGNPESLADVRCAALRMP